MCVISEQRRSLYFHWPETKDFESLGDGKATKWKAPGSLISREKKATCDQEQVWLSQARHLDLGRGKGQLESKVKGLWGSAQDLQNSWSTGRTYGHIFLHLHSLPNTQCNACV